MAEHNTGTLTGAETWSIDPAHTTVEFSVKHMMFTKVRGRFTEVAGTITADREHPDASTVEVVIGAASIDTGVADRDNHLRSADFLDVESHPRLTFRSTRVEDAAMEEGDEFDVVGKLTIRGTTREVTLRCRFEGLGKDPWGGERAGFNARTKLDRRDFGLSWNQTLEAGGVLVGNDVEIDIECQAVKQE